MGSGTDEGTGPGVDAAAGDTNDTNGDNRPEPMADFLAKVTGVLATRIARGAYMQSMAALVAGGRTVDEAATIAGELFDRAEVDINDVEMRLHLRDD